MRISVRIDDKNSVHTFISLFVNGALCSSVSGICLRNEEVDEFLKRMKVDKIIE